MKLTDIKYWPNQVKQGIKNLYHWFPIIWKDRDWDHYYFFKIMQFKLKNMEYIFRHDAMHLGAEKQADKMHICVLLLQRLIDDNYLLNVFKFHDKKWGELGSGEVDPNEVFSFKRKNVITKEDEIQENKEYNHLSHKEDELIKQDLNYLFTILYKNIQYWWD